MTLKEAHDIRAAMRTIEAAHALLEMGYRFDDSKASILLERLELAVQLISRTVSEVVLPPLSPTNRNGLDDTSAECRQEHR